MFAHCDDVLAVYLTNEINGDVLKICERYTNLASDQEEKPTVALI